jgi:D-alanyl-D-alanine carboxypeptidase (penicillin-binding protein 5/6)
MRNGPSRWRHLWLVVPLVILLVVAAGVGQYLRPIPRIKVVRTVSAQIRIPGSAAKLTWPSTGEGAVAVAGVSSIGTSGGDRPEAIGSIAKVMTALLVLKAHPIGVGLSGPEITVTAQDVTTYEAAKAGQQSVVAVASGEQISELQALQALLIPSGNNIATLLAEWDAGSQTAFVSQMNAEATRLGLRHTHYSDASGLSASTVSDAADQTRLAEVAMANLTFASIVVLPQVSLPVAGVAYNVNAEVTHDGFIGVKTGSTSEAGGCFVFAVQRPVGGSQVTVVGAVLGQGGASALDTALSAGQALVDSAFKSLTTFTVVPRDGVVASLTQPWAASVTIGSPTSLTVVGWPGLVIKMKVSADRLGDAVATGRAVGSLRLEEGLTTKVVPLHTPAAVHPPSLRWRLTRL